MYLCCFFCSRKRGNEYDDEDSTPDFECCPFICERRQHPVPEESSESKDDKSKSPSKDEKSPESKDEEFDSSANLLPTLEGIPNPSPDYYASLSDEVVATALKHAKKNQLSDETLYDFLAEKIDATEAKIESLLPAVDGLTARLNKLVSEMDEAAPKGVLAEYYDTEAQGANPPEDSDSDDDEKGLPMVASSRHRRDKTGVGKFYGRKIKSCSSNELLEHAVKFRTQRRFGLSGLARAVMLSMSNESAPGAEEKEAERKTAPPAEDE
jgi:hypothetical protein